MAKFMRTLLICAKFHTVAHSAKPAQACLFDWLFGGGCYHGSGICYPYSCGGHGGWGGYGYGGCCDYTPSFGWNRSCYSVMPAHYTSYYAKVTPGATCCGTGPACCASISDNCCNGVAVAAVAAPTCCLAGTGYTVSSQQLATARPSYHGQPSTRAPVVALLTRSTTLASR